MREIQTEMAEILQMERWQDKRISGAKRIEPKVYADIKEQECQAWSNTNKALHEQGAEKKIKKKNNKELRELDKDAKEKKNQQQRNMS